MRWKHLSFAGVLVVGLFVAAFMVVPDANAAPKHKQNQAQQAPGEIGQVQSQQSQTQAKGAHAGGMLSVTIVRREGHRAGGVLVRVRHIGPHGGGHLVATRHMIAGTMAINGPVGRYRVIALHRGGRQVRGVRVLSGRSSHVVITIRDHGRRHHHRHERFLLGLHHRHHHLHHHGDQKPKQPSKSSDSFTPGISPTQSAAGKGAALPRQP